MGDHGSQSIHSRILCVNCNISVNRLSRYKVLTLDPRAAGILCSWVYPQIVSNEDYACEACRDLAMATVNDNQQVSGVAQPGPSQQGHTSVCFMCGCSTLRRRSNKILRNHTSELLQSMIAIIQSRVPRQVTETDGVCHACWMRVQREARKITDIDLARNTLLTPQGTHQSPAQQELQPLQSPPQPLPIDSPSLERPQAIESPPHEEPQVVQSRPHEQPEALRQEELVIANNCVTLPNYRRSANTNSHCIFPNCASTSLHSVNDRLRAIIVREHKYYISKDARVCQNHLMGNTWESLFESQNSYSIFTSGQVEHVFSFLNNNETLDFENIDNIDERVFQYWIGRTKECFSILWEEVPRLHEIRRGKLGLLVFILKLRTGDSDERISSLVNVPRRTLEGLMDKVREILLQDFVPVHLGIGHICREDLMSHTLHIPNGLYGNGNNCVVICDGTYIYINKSANYMFQKQTYSLHKYRNLLKPFMIVASDGYIVDCYGPYKATTSDADIMKELFREESALRSYFQEGDVFILDRGFRDSLSLLEECGYRPCMPESLMEGEHQLTTAQANRSRCVTICRWVVEAVNGHFKRDFKLLRQEYCHRSLPHMMQNFQIAAALLNRFGVRFENNTYATEILEIIRDRMEMDNNLANMVDILNMNRRSSQFINICADQNNLLYFPTLEYRDLILFALGTYQIKQARSYYGEHVRFHGGYLIEVSTGEQINPTEYNLRGSTGSTTLIRGKIKSRHVSRKQYYVYIIVENNIPGRSSILEYTCSCLVGRRTVGCCAHVMTIVWYLGWARRQEYITPPAENLDEIFVRDDDFD